MKPIQELLNRIRWDEEYSKADFAVGYYDRVENRIIHVPFRELYFDRNDHFNFQLLDEDGISHTIPFHRIKEVYKNGDLIWQREH